MRDQELRDLLDSTIGPEPSMNTSVDETVMNGRKRHRRRTYGVIAGATAAVALLAGGAYAVVPGVVGTGHNPPVLDGGDGGTRTPAPEPSPTRAERTPEPSPATEAPHLPPSTPGPEVPSPTEAPGTPRSTRGAEVPPAPTHGPGTPPATEAPEPGPTMGR